MATKFRPALIVVDVQEDFCPPNGALAIPEGRYTVGPINQLLALPFVLKVATKDWHPHDHISFAVNHAGKRPFVDSVAIANPHNPAESHLSRLWPVHCVQGTAGAELVPELDAEKLDSIVVKGTDRRIEMYSPFYGPFKSPRVCDSGLGRLLRDHGVTDVYVVGLAGDYCVKYCAEDAAKEGFRTYLVEEGTRPVDIENWPWCKKSMERLGVRVVSMKSHEVLRLSDATSPDEHLAYLGR